MADKNKNGTTEKIHGKKRKIGKGVGERVAKKALSAIEERKRRIREELYGT
ncbi:MAG: hypothetical protein V3U97_00340 [bacterium]